MLHILQSECAIPSHLPMWTARFCPIDMSRSLGPWSHWHCSAQWVADRSSSSSQTCTQWVRQGTHFRHSGSLRTLHHLLHPLHCGAVYSTPSSDSVTTVGSVPPALHFFFSQRAETELDTSTFIFEGDMWAEQLTPGSGLLQISWIHSWIIYISWVCFFRATYRELQSREDTWLWLEERCEWREDCIRHGPSQHISSVNFQPFGGR